MSLPEDIDSFLDPILAAFQGNLALNVQGHLINSYLVGSAQMIAWGRTKLKQLPILYEGPPMQEAINYAAKHMSKAKLVDNITAETRTRLSEIISDGIKNKRGIDGIARDLRTELSWKGKFPSEIKGLSLKDRSEMIARTETADALEQAFIDRSKGMGVTGKEWVVTEPCEICQLNDGVIIPINDVFPSGDSRPPAHPNCRCALAPVML